MFRFERDWHGPTQVYFEVIRLSQAMVYDNVIAPPNRKLKTHTARIPMPEGERFSVEFRIDDAPVFVAQINNDGDDSDAWFTAYDGAGNELSALSIARKGGAE